MKGIILVGLNETISDSESEIYPKQLITVYDKPLIYYPLTILIQAGIKEIMLISLSSFSLDQFENLLGDGSQWGIKLTYLNYPKPASILQILLMAEEFIANEPIAVISSELIILGHNLKNILKQSVDLAKQGNAVIIGKNKYYNEDFIENIMFINELKDKSEQENFVPVGLNFYPATFIEVCKNAEKHIEFDFQAINKNLYENNTLKLMLINERTQIFNTTNFEVLSEIAVLLKSLYQNSGIKTGCIDDIAIEMGYVK